MFRKKKNQDAVVCLEGIEKRLRMLECDHKEWEYNEETIHWISGIFYMKKCKLCGKTEHLTAEQWLEEQAEFHYAKHVEWINELNKYYKED